MALAPRPWLRRAAIGAVASLLLLGCGSDDDGGGDEASATSAAPETTEAPDVANSCADVPEADAGSAVNQGAVVNLIDFEFCQADIDIQAGQAVEFVNNGAARHQVAHDPPGDQAREFRSDPMLPGDTFLQTFDTPGVYPYICSFHFDVMMGTITVS